MDVPRIGDTFISTCPFCSPDKGILHAIRMVVKKGKKHDIDGICTCCFKTTVGSFNKDDEVVYITWLDYKSRNEVERIKTEQIKEFKFNKEIQEKLLPPPKLTNNAEQKISDEVCKILEKKQFDSKGSLEVFLCEKFPEFGEINLNFNNTIKMSFPYLSRIAKSLRLKGKIPFTIKDGHHVYGQGKKIKIARNRSTNLAWKVVKKNKLLKGPIKASILTYIPSDDEKAFQHFFQAVFPKAKITTSFGEVTLYSQKAKVDRIAHFKVDEIIFSFTISPFKLEVTGNFQEKNLSCSLIKAAIISQSLAYEIACTGHKDQHIIKIDNKYNFPSIFLIRNGLKHSETLWKTKYTNIHRNFYSFPEKEDNEVSISQRLILSHTLSKQEFDQATVDKVFNHFRVLFIKDIVRSLLYKNVYVPISIIKAYAPQDEEMQKFIEQITNTYEEKLKKNQIERENKQKELDLFINRSNLWLSIIVLLFSFGTLINSNLLNIALLVFAIIFVGFIFIQNYKKAKEYR